MDNMKLSIIIIEDSHSRISDTGASDTYSSDHEGLRQTLESIVCQNYKPLEIFHVTNPRAGKSADFSGYSDISNFHTITPDSSLTSGGLYSFALKHINTPFVMFMKEHDTLAPGFIDHSMSVFYHTKNGSHSRNLPLCAAKYFLLNPIVSSSPTEHTLSKNYIREIDDSYIRDVSLQPQAILVGPDACIFKTEAVISVGFNEQLDIEEDADFMLRFLLKYPSYNVVPEAKYYYFQPKANEVLYHLNAHFDEWYEKSMTGFLFPLLEHAKDTCGCIPAFIQNYCMFYMNCRFMANQDNRDKKIVIGQRFEAYLDLIRRLFNQIDDFHLLNQEALHYITTNPEIRCMYLRIKYGADQVHYEYVPVEMPAEERSELGDYDLEMRFGDCMISRLSAHRISINIMNYINGELWIDGSLISIFQYADIHFFVTFNGKDYPITDTTAYAQTKYFGVPGYRRLPFFLKFKLDPAKKHQRITFYAQYQGKKYPMKMTFANHWAKLSKSPRYSYWRFNQYLCHHANNGISIRKASAFNVLKRELQLQLQLICKKNKEPFKFRLLYWLTRPYFRKKKIWLMLDKLYKGGDSAEYLYRFCAHKDDGITRYYLINKDTSDYKQLKADGFKPLINGSLLHKLVFVNADLLLITNSHLFPFNGYTKETSKYIRGLCNFGSMCLQHGLSVQKCAIAQRRIIDNTMMYFLGSKYEYENLSRHAYGYQGFDMLKLTGIGRYDGLVSDDKKQILISPTWRMYNALPVTTSEGEQRGYNPEFKNTTYFKIYNQLINHEKLIHTAKKYGYKIKYLLHPIISSQVDDFTPNPELEVIPSVGDLSYEQILTQSSLMVTDYSGVQFDFAYMRKPVVYFHPEELPPHYEDGVFFYDTMGFGEICTKTEQLVDLLCEYMKNGCAMKDTYRRRADDFFAWDDHHNCERIYDEIMKFQAIIDKDKGR